MDALKLLGQNLKHYRARQELTQQDLADRSGVNRSHLAGIESGSLNPAVKTVEKLARALGVTVADLFAPEPGQADD